MYPDNTRLIVADPNPYFERYFSENKAKFPNIKTETIIVAKGMNAADAKQIYLFHLRASFCRRKCRVFAH